MRAQLKHLVILAELPSVSLRLEKPEQVRSAAVAFDQLAAQALTPEKSMAMLGRLAHETGVGKEACRDE